MTNITSQISAASLDLTTNKPKTVTAESQSSLDKDAFLKLLAAQAKTQDPMNPTDSTQQIAQLAQFSSLEQMLNVATAMSKVQGAVQQQGAVQLVGHQVTYTDAAGGGTVTGTVESVSLGADGVRLTISGTSGIDPSLITEVR